MQLYHDKPQSKGVENALKRARQMVEIQWTPRRMIPCGYGFSSPTSTKKTFIDAWFPAHLPQVGMIYSSPRKYGKLVGINVSIETYMTALANPNSVLYTRPLHGTGRCGFSFYGTVCSAFASYVCQLPHSVATAGWLSVPGVSPIELTCLEELQLCDMLLIYDTLRSKTHISVITDILRDVDGKVHRITVAESTTPRCRSTDFTPEQFRAYWLDDGYQVIRYAGIHNVTYTPSPYVPLEGDPCTDPPVYNSVFMADYGDKANYALGETVAFSVFEEGWDAVEISRPDGATDTLPITDGSAVYTPDIPGYHTAVCRKGDCVSRSVDFCATQMTVAVEKEVLAKGEPIAVSFRNATPEDKAVVVSISTAALFHGCSRTLTAQEAADGRVYVEHALAPGRYVASVIIQGKYGNYAARSAEFTVE